MKAHNTLTGVEEELILGKIVKFYLCGPTVYDFIHIGNARPLIFFDAVRRYLELDREVVFIQNFTDIDDKIISKAIAENVNFRDLTDRYIEEYRKDAAALNVKEPTFSPRATDYVQSMIEDISQMIKSGIAYAKPDGIYFLASYDKDYGQLSKRDSKDEFALWKFEENEAISWQSPFGRGRPGWHIECSTMIGKIAQNLDIHAGGQDLIFPHHENEIAQHNSLNRGVLAKYWFHNSFINFGAKKMSKSEGNVQFIRDLLKHYSGNIIRMLILSTHYRKPINLMEDSFSEAEKAFKKIDSFLKTNYLVNGDEEFSINIWESFMDYMDNDFNTQGAISLIFQSIKQFHKQLNISKSSYLKMKEDLLKVLQTLGFILSLEYDENIEREIIQREKLRAEKNFSEADNIRIKLEKEGIKISDGTRISWQKF